MGRWLDVLGKGAALTLPLSARSPSGWKVKIRDRDRLEPPHVTVVSGVRAWRWNLRSRAWMDLEPDPREVPEDICQAILENVETLSREWDRMYLTNPVGPEVDSDE